MADVAEDLYLEADNEVELDDSGRDDALMTAIEDREATAIGRDSDPVSIDRAEAINYYLGQPFGNEIEGRSQVVSKDVFDTIEWIKPALLRIFAGGDQIAEFVPQDEEDIQGAEQESDYINYVIQRKNQWFSLCNTWFTDALMTRNAYALAYWDEQEEPTLERYRGLTDDQLALIAMDEVEITQHQAYPAPAPIPNQMALTAIQQGIIQAFPQVMFHDVEVRRTKKTGCCKIEVLPPERCLIAEDAKKVSVRDADFFEYWEWKTLSSLRADGFDVPDDISDTGGTSRGIVDETRDVTNSTILSEDNNSTDPAMRKVKARMVWIRNDYDGDGIAELRYVVAVGSNILANEEVSCVPVASIVPYPMPHRHIGLSIHDIVSDIQLIKSAMQRQVIDNAYLANNSRTAVDKNVVNLDDLAVSRPGGIVRVDGPPGAGVMPLVVPPTAQHGITVLQYFDGIREDRGGVSKPFAGADLEAIQAQPGTIAQLTSSASQKLEQIARILSEGVRELFLTVHEITLSNATVQDKVQLRNKWVGVDPRQWKKRQDMTLMVGLGVGNRQQHLTAIAALLGLQEKAMQVGLTSPPKIYNALKEYVKAMGFSSCKQFFDEPDPEKPFQPQPPYQIIVAQIKAQADLMAERIKQDGDLQLTQMKEEAAATRSYFETSLDAQNQAQDRFIRAISETTERMQEMRLEQMRTSSGKSPSMNISVDGAAVSDTVKKALRASEDSTKRVDEIVKELDAIKQKPKRRTIKAPSGKTYIVEDA